MQPIYQAVLRSWSIPPAATFAIALSALVYLRGWWLLRCAGAPFLPPWRAAAFLAGLFSLWVALASPMDVFNSFILTAHMLQHMVLMMVAPPLILLGAPLIPMVRGLPVFAAREFAGPFVNWSIAKRVGHSLTNPVCALLLMGLAMFAWHTPALYELALRSPVWHQVEHACFLVTSLIFWWPVVQPWPSKTQWPRWAMVPYLLIADLQNTALSAILVFSDRALYPSYSTTPRLFGFSALEDQAAAGAIMWVVGSVAFVVPAIVIAVQCLSSRTRQTLPAPPRRQDRTFNDGLLPVGPRIPFLRDFLQTRLTARTIEALTFGLLFAMTSLCFAGLLAAGSNDDENQVLRYRQTSGPFAVAVFAPAGDLPTGSTPFSTLVQDRNGQVLLDATVDLSAHSDADSQGASSSTRASHDGSENKLLQTAQLNLPSEGDWELRITVRRNSEAAGFSLPVHVVQTAVEFEFPWSYFLVLTVALLLVFAYALRHWPRAAQPVAQSIAD